MKSSKITTKAERRKLGKALRESCPRTSQAEWKPRSKSHAIIQARDLATAKVSGITVQACGDCHLANFGAFASPERAFLFDINDFDETYPGPWEWDIKRLGASLILAARDCGFSKGNANEAVHAAAASYREHMIEYSEMTLLERYYAAVTF